MEDGKMAACRQFYRIIIERSSIFDRANAHATMRYFVSLEMRSILEIGTPNCV